MKLDAVVRKSASLYMSLVYIISCFLFGICDMSLTSVENAKLAVPLGGLQDAPWWLDKAVEMALLPLEYVSKIILVVMCFAAPP